MVITKLKRTKKGNRVSLFIDGEFAFSVPRNFISEYALYQGKKISESARSKLKLKAQVSYYLDSIKKLVMRRPRSEKEVKVYLQKKIHTKEDKNSLIEHIIRELKQKDMIDDRGFAQWWIQNRITFKPRGEFLLRSELIKKGIKKDIIDYALEVVDYKKNAEKMALEVGKKKVRQLGTLNNQKSMKKFISFLMRKGFSYALSKKVYSRLVNNKKHNFNLYKYD